MPKEQDKKQLKIQYKTRKAAIEKFIDTFCRKGHVRGTSHLTSLSARVFTIVEIWLRAEVLPLHNLNKCLLKRVFRKLGHYLRRVAWGWSGKSVTNFSKLFYGNIVEINGKNTGNKNSGCKAVSVFKSV